MAPLIFLMVSLPDDIIYIAASACCCNWVLLQLVNYVIV